jgi:hypothetical protein
MKTTKKLVFSVLKMDNWNTYLPAIQILYLPDRDNSSTLEVAWINRQLARP